MTSVPGVNSSGSFLSRPLRPTRSQKLARIWSAPPRRQFSGSQL
jgi:hypothetical protein